MALNNPTGRTITTISREEALHRFWRAECDAGADNVTATERMTDFAKLLDSERDDFRTINRALERTR